LPKKEELIFEVEFDIQNVDLPSSCFHLPLVLRASVFKLIAIVKPEDQIYKDVTAMPCGRLILNPEIIIRAILCGGGGRGGGRRPGRKREGTGGVREMGEEGTGSRIPKMAGNGRKRGK